MAMVKLKILLLNNCIGALHNTLENIDLLFSLLRYDLSITTLPKLFFSNKPELAWIALLYPSLNRQIGVFKRANKYIPPPFQAFYELCIDYGKNHYLIQFMK